MNPLLNKPLHEMSHREWEALCDGCGRCCLLKLENEYSGEIFYTDVACRLLDMHSCRCSDYTHRTTEIPDCLVLSADRPDYLKILPSSCAYRLRNDGHPLAEWHPLLSGDPESIHHAGISVRNRCISEEEVPEEALEDHIIDLATDCP